MQKLTFMIESKYHKISHRQVNAANYDSIVLSVNRMYRVTSDDS